MWIRRWCSDGAAGGWKQLEGNDFDLISGLSLSLSVILSLSPLFLPSVSLPANSSSLALAHPKAAQTEQWRRLESVCVCVFWEGGGDLTLKKMEEQVSPFKSAWHPKSNVAEACSSFPCKNSALSGLLLIFLLLLQRQEWFRQVWPFRLQEMPLKKVTEKRERKKESESESEINRSFLGRSSCLDLRD